MLNTTVLYLMTVVQCLLLAYTRGRRQCNVAYNVSAVAVTNDYIYGGL